jgi:hypothetical protein
MIKKCVLDFSFRSHFRFQALSEAKPYQTITPILMFHFLRNGVTGKKKEAKKERKSQLLFSAFFSISNIHFRTLLS